MADTPQLNMDFKRIGVDIGSTTVKVVVLDSAHEVLYKLYTRHNSEVRQTVLQCIEDLQKAELFSPFTPTSIVITGSGGIDVAQIIGSPFTQEVVSCAKAVESLIPSTDVCIELGGEDAKITFFTNGIEQRMNGACAGGTGAFIDQMASLLQTDALGLNALAAKAKNIYPIAARCGVFAKTDVQPLLNEGVPKEDIALSIFQAVAHQSISGLACGRKIKGNVAFLGGPLNFLPELKKRFIETLGLSPENIMEPQDSQLFVAVGAAMHAKPENARMFQEVLDSFNKLKEGNFRELNTLPPLFKSEEELGAFKARHDQAQVARADLSSYQGNAFLGLDCGSTTTKAALISDNNELLYTYYGSNQGDPLKVVASILKEVYAALPPTATIAASSVTGYGEALMKEAYKIDFSEVETIAHYKAANHFLHGVDFILDIGGQDMKCMRVKDGVIDNILLNEACSSGCGSFLETFAESASMPITEFAKIALESKSPADLGSRCTVFMNSSVKQAQKEGATAADISAGLSYAVIKNALIKVIKIKNPQDLGNKIIVQGGTFYNNAVLRAFELISGREPVRPDIAGLMGAFGSALIAKERWQGQEESTMLSTQAIEQLSVRHSMLRCNVCENSCSMTVNRFSDGRKFIMGNRCERGLGSKEASKGNLPNLYDYKYERVFNYEPLSLENAPRGEIAIPRVLNMYENYPLWFTFFTALGYRVALSSTSSKSLMEQGLDTMPSDSMCYPAKLANGHIVDLLNRGCKTIFYPCIAYEFKEFVDSHDHFNCPVVTSYPELIRNNIDRIKEEGVEFIQPFLSLEDEKRLAKRLVEIFSPKGISPKEICAALHAAWVEQEQYRKDIQNKGEEILAYLEENNIQGIVLAGRPYHIDPEIHHGIPNIITSLGMAVLSEDSIAHLCKKMDMPMRVVDQWTYHARVYRAANVMAKEQSLEMIQLNSFGCGLDSVVAEQAQELLEAAEKIYTTIKIDEINNLGAARIRIRSLKAALNEREMKAKTQDLVPQPIKFFPSPARTQEKYANASFTQEMKKGYTIIAPQMSPLHFQFYGPAIEACGYNLKVLEDVPQSAVDVGLRFVNNDACYPSIIVVGQIVGALLSGEYDTDKVAVMITQTGGGCRATNYISYLRKALHDAGLGHVPIISLNALGMEKHEGFSLSLPMLHRLLMASVYGDILMKVLFQTRPYEKVKGSANALHDKWAQRCKEALVKADMKTFKQISYDMIADFDNLELLDIKKPRVGLVGEILVKYHPTANNDLVSILEAEGCEAVMPGIIDFFLYCAYDYDFKHSHLSKGRLAAIAGGLAVKGIEFYRRHMRKALTQSRRFTAPHSIDELAFGAAPLLSRGNQTGEGWFLSAEMVSLINEGVNNIVCMQPFACLPNHIIGKGVMKALKDLYPQANSTVIDYDPGASEVNQLNRIKLMLSAAFQQLEKDEQVA
ncbi:MAG: acyl-CoA dehydratase activase-related protein [Saezia sp.]